MESTSFKHALLLEDVVQCTSDTSALSVSEAVDAYMKMTTDVPCAPTHSPHADVLGPLFVELREYWSQFGFLDKNASLSSFIHALSPAVCIKNDTTDQEDGEYGDGMDEGFE